MDAIAPSDLGAMDAVLKRVAVLYLVCSIVGTLVPFGFGASIRFVQNHQGDYCELQLPPSEWNFEVGGQGCRVNWTHIVNYEVFPYLLVVGVVNSPLLLLLAVRTRVIHTASANAARSVPNAGRTAAVECLAPSARSNGLRGLTTLCAAVAGLGSLAWIGHGLYIAGWFLLRFLNGPPPLGS